METTNDKWYQSPVVIIILLFIFFPVGIYLMWKYTNLEKKKKWIFTIIFTIIGLIGISTIGSESSTKVQQNNLNSNPIQPSPSTIQEPRTKVVDKQIALDNVNNAAKRLSGDPLYLATKWYGEDDIRFVIQVDRLSWDLLTHDDKEGLLLAVGEASDIAGFLSMWVIDNRTQEKLADYRLGRIKIEK